MCNQEVASVTQEKARGENLHIRWIGLEVEVEPELLPLPELPVLFFRKVAYGFELSCGEEDIPARKNGEGR